MPDGSGAARRAVVLHDRRTTADAARRARWVETSGRLRRRGGGPRAGAPAEAGREAGDGRARRDAPRDALPRIVHASPCVSKASAVFIA